MNKLGLNRACLLKGGWGDRECQNHGQLYEVRIYMTLPTGEIVVKRNPPQHQSHENIYVAIRDAFNAAKRKLQEHTTMLRK